MFEVLTPRTLDEALDAMASGGSIVPLAGGTDLMVGLDAGVLAPCTFLNLQEVGELQSLSANGELLLGALATYRDVRRSSVRTVYPILARLKEDGLLQSEWVEADAGHPRKYYWLTAPGRQKVVSMAQFWNSFAANINGLLKPILNGKGRA